MKKKAHLANATTGTLRLLKPICGRAWVEKRVPRDSDVSEKQACKMKCDSITFCMPDSACPYT